MTTSNLSRSEIKRRKWSITASVYQSASNLTIATYATKRSSSAVGSHRPARSESRSLVVNECPPNARASTPQEGGVLHQRPPRPGSAAFACRPARPSTAPAQRRSAIALGDHDDEEDDGVFDLGFDDDFGEPSSDDEPELKADAEGELALFDVSKAVARATADDEMLTKQISVANLRPDLVHFEPLKNDHGSGRHRFRPMQDCGLRYVMAHGCPAVVRRLLDQAGMHRVRLDPGRNSFDLLWTGTPMASRRFQSLSLRQIVNRFPKTVNVARKDLLFRSIAKMWVKAAGRGIPRSESFPFLPDTYIMPGDRDALYRAFASGEPAGHLWIVKPFHSSQGRGVFVTDRWRQIPTHSQVVVSRYIDAPLLLDGRKCDLRLFVLVTSFDPLRVYVHGEGLVRIATERYTTSRNKLTNRFVHLTNSSVNARNSNYFVSDDPTWSNVGNKWSLAGFRQHLRSVSPEHGADPNVILWPKVNELIVKTLISIEQLVVDSMAQNCPSRLNCFELFGFDVLVDSALNPWLLEVNQAPSLRCDTGLDMQIKSTMLADMFNMLSLQRGSPLASSSLPDGAAASRAARITRHRRARSSILRQAPLGHAQAGRPSSANGARVSYRNVVVKSSAQARIRDLDTAKHEIHQRLPSMKKPSTGPPKSSMANAAASDLLNAIARETDTEYERRGSFLRIFPTAQWRRFKDVFAVWAPLNQALCKRIEEEDNDAGSDGYANNKRGNGSGSASATSFSACVDKAIKDPTGDHDVSSVLDIKVREGEPDHDESETERQQRLIEDLRARFGMQYRAR